MSIGGQGSLSKIKYSGFYLPSVAYGYLSLIDGYKLTVLFISINLYLALSAFTLLAAVITHGILRSILGPESVESNLTNKSSLLQRGFAVIFNSARPSQYPASLSDISNHNFPDVPTVRARFSILIPVLMIGLIISIPHNLYLLYGIVSAKNLFPAGLFFLQVAWILRLTTFSLWEPAYIIDKFSGPEYHSNLREFSLVLYEYRKIADFDCKYETRDGGRLLLQYQSTATDAAEEEDVFQTIISAFSGSFRSSDFPISCLEAEVFEKGERVANYTLEIESANRYSDGEISQEKVLELLVEKVEYLD